jgi:aminoglycoside 3-N-acetyltransferase I
MGETTQDRLAPADPPGWQAPIRQLAPDDLAAMHGLLDLYGEAFEELETYGRARPDEAYLRDLLATPTFITLVAEHAGEVIAGLCAYVLPKFEQARSEVYIYDLAVASPWRRRGIATRLIEALKPIAARRGAWVIFVQADRQDGAAVALYEKLGVREEPLHFDIPLG